MFMSGEIGRYERIFLKCGYTDLRCGIRMLSDLLTMIYSQELKEGYLYLFCGRSARKIKGLICQEEGVMLITLQLTDPVKWNRQSDDFIEVTESQLLKLLHGEAISL